MWKKSLKLSLWMLLDSCKSKTLINSYSISLQQLNPNYSGNNFRRTWKLQTLWETTFAKRGNAKPFGKWLSPSAEMPNLLKSDLREVRKRKILLKVICGRPASTKSFKKWFAGGPQASNYSGKYFRHARKRQTIRETTFGERGNTKLFGKRLSPCAET